MNGREIIQKYLKEDGFDGLESPSGCCCQLNDLANCWEAGCGNEIVECEPFCNSPQRDSQKLTEEP